jgi:hypothetical protein
LLLFLNVALSESFFSFPPFLLSPPIDLGKIAERDLFLFP